MELTLKDVMTTTLDSLHELDVAAARYDGEQRGLARGRKLGLAKGEKLGLAKGKKYGRAEGEKAGRKSTISEFIMKMLKKNMKYSDISDITGVSVDEIESYSHEIDISKAKEVNQS